MSQHIDVATRSDKFSLQNQAQILLSIFITGQTTDTLEKAQSNGREFTVKEDGPNHRLSGKMAKSKILGFVIQFVL
jgi:hypothetical protein